jgi:mycothiol system anti-sigma-R factor
MGECEETLRELYSFLDDELGASSRQQVQHHLESCADCYQAFDFHAELRIVIAEKCRHDEVPPGLMDRVKSCFGPPALGDSPGDAAPAT